MENVAFWRYFLTLAHLGCSKPCGNIVLDKWKIWG